MKKPRAKKKLWGLWLLFADRRGLWGNSSSLYQYYFVYALLLVAFGLKKVIFF
jgi:hypothetical protein